MTSNLINKNRLQNLQTITLSSLAVGYNPLELWSKCRPPESEVIAIKKIISLGRKFHSNLYFVHPGSNQSLDAILMEKQFGGCNVYVETCPH